MVCPCTLFHARALYIEALHAKPGLRAFFACIPVAQEARRRCHFVSEWLMSEVAVRPTHSYIVLRSRWSHNEAAM